MLFSINLSNKNKEGNSVMSRSKTVKREILKYVGDISQLFGVKNYTLHGGRAEGVRGVDVKNGSGLEFTVLADRCLDIANLSYKGVNFSYISKTGIVAPQYFEEPVAGFARNFHGGFLSTCGLRNVGSPCEDDGEKLGAHGRISNTPGEQVYAGVEWEDGVPTMKVKGQMREAKLVGENLYLNREILCKYGKNKVYINDIVENNGFRKEPLMLLYHFNLGYPLLSGDSYLVAPTEDIMPKSPEAEAGIKEHNKFQEPTPGYNEQVFYHKLRADSEGKTFAALINPVLELGLVIRFDMKQLGRFTQWKMMAEGDYVLGMEPCNCLVEGRAKARETGTLEFLEPGEKRDFNLEIEVLEGRERIKEFENSTLLKA
jgi:hypothetical protein